MALRRQTHHQIAAHDECLLVCQSDLLSGLYGGDGGDKSGISDKCVYHHVDLLRADDLPQRLFSREYLDRV